MTDLNNKLWYLYLAIHPGSILNWKYGKAEERQVKGSQVQDKSSSGVKESHLKGLFTSTWELAV